MIGYLNGNLAIKDPTYVIVDVNGVGYEVKIFKDKGSGSLPVTYIPACKGRFTYFVWFF